MSRVGNLTMDEVYPKETNADLMKRRKYDRRTTRMLGIRIPTECIKWLNRQVLRRRMTGGKYKKWSRTKEIVFLINFGMLCERAGVTGLRITTAKEMAGEWKKASDEKEAGANGTGRGEIGLGDSAPAQANRLLGDTAAVPVAAGSDSGSSQAVESGGCNDLQRSGEDQ